MLKEISEQLKTAGVCVCRVGTMRASQKQKWRVDYTLLKGSFEQATHCLWLSRNIISISEFFVQQHCNLSKFCTKRQSTFAKPINTSGNIMLVRVSSHIPLRFCFVVLPAVLGGWSDPGNWCYRRRTQISSFGLSHQRSIVASSIFASVWYVLTASSNFSRCLQGTTTQTVPGLFKVWHTSLVGIYQARFSVHLAYRRAWTAIDARQTEFLLSLLERLIYHYLMLTSNVKTIVTSAKEYMHSSTRWLGYKSPPIN